MDDTSANAKAVLAMKDALETKGDIYGLHPRTEKLILDAMNGLEAQAAEMKPKMKPIKSEPKDCGWSPDGDEEWVTDCGKNFNFTDGGIADNGFEFCPFCGGAITILNEGDS